MKLIVLLCLYFVGVLSELAPLQTTSPDGSLRQYLVGVKRRVVMDEFLASMNESAIDNGYIYEVANTSYDQGTFIISLAEEHVDWLRNLRGVKFVEEIGASQVTVQNTTSTLTTPTPNTTPNTTPTTISTTSRSPTTTMTTTTSVSTAVARTTTQRQIWTLEPLIASSNGRSCNYRGQTILHGDQLMVDVCTTCSCDNTTVRCDIKSCPPTFCDAPIIDPSECCDICPYSEEQDVKLTGGSDNFKGFVQVYNASQWWVICPDTWTREASDLVCKKLGLFGKAMTTMSTNRYNVPVTRNVIGIRCNNSQSWDECDFFETECSPDNAVKVQCALPNYIGCFPDSERSRALVGNVASDLLDVTIDGCTSSCREKGFAYAGLVAPSTCLCGSAGESMDEKEKLPDDTCVEGCSGDASQACGKSGEAAAVYDVSVGNCGGRIKAKEGIVASPGFPEKYSRDNEIICHWVIDLSENGDTLLEFNMFDLEINTEDEVAYAEDGGTFTGFKFDQPPDKIITSADSLRIRFTIASRSGPPPDGISLKGFLATFSDATTCGDEDIINGTLGLEEGMEYRPGDKVNLFCDDGYLPNYSQLLCKSTGRWYPVPKCKAGRSMMPSLVFTTTLLYMMVTFVGVLGIIILSIIIAMMCIRSKKKSEGYKGISSGESGYQKGPDDLDEKDTKVEMQDGMDDGMDMMHSNEQAIPLATAGVE